MTFVLIVTNFILIVSNVVTFCLFGAEKRRAEYLEEQNRLELYGKPRINF